MRRVVEVSVVVAWRLIESGPEVLARRREWLGYWNHHICNGGQVTEYRIEHDTMGEVRVPKDALYAAQTQRAVENFPILGRGLSPHHIAALGQIKRAAAIANAELGVLDRSVADAIVSAAEEVIAGRHDDRHLNPPDIAA